VTETFERHCNWAWSAGPEDRCSHHCYLLLGHAGDHECAHYRLPQRDDMGLIKKEAASCDVTAEE